MNTLFLRYLKEMQNKGRLKFYENHSLSLVSTFGIGGRARVFVIPKDTETFTDTVRLASKYGRYAVIGNASNLLFDDKGFFGTVISTVNLRTVGILTKPRLCEDNAVLKKSGEKRVIKADCGVMLPTLAAFALKNAFTGFEGLCSVPATVGGAIFMNASAYGTEISDKLIAYEIYCAEEDEKRLVFADKSAFSYRKSPIGKNGEILLCAYFKAEAGDTEQIKARMEQCKGFRAASQPIGERSAGSFFKRPNVSDPQSPFFEKSAGELIDLCGLKGTCVGGAAVSQKHANFIVNKGGATASDVRSLADKIKKTVHKRFGIMLCEEVEYVQRYGKSIK